MHQLQRTERTRQEAQQADEGDAGGRPSFLVKSRDGARDAALRAHNERRKLTHFKCDNSAKV